MKQDKVSPSTMPGKPQTMGFLNPAGEALVPDRLIVNRLGFNAMVRLYLILPLSGAICRFYRRLATSPNCDRDLLLVSSGGAVTPVILVSLPPYDTRDFPIGQDKASVFPVRTQQLFKLGDEAII